MSSGRELYLAVDIGGTKILAALVDASGIALCREKCPTPREKGHEPLCDTLEKTITGLLDKSDGVALGDITAMGIGVPGVVDMEQGLVVVTPNMGLSNTQLGPICEKLFGLPVVLGNDCNVGILGERWLGSARDAESAMGILVGTGVGGGFIQGSQVWSGSRGLAAEIGHIVMQIDGPLCGCGNRGCLEALASRTAIERDLHAAISAGRTSVLTELLTEENQLIRSGILRQALALGDTLVTEVIQHAADVLGHACLTVSHLLDPEVIVLGGGVIEACSEYMVPIIQKIVADDKLGTPEHVARVLVSSLGDDAVLLGATALARLHVGKNPFKKRYEVLPAYSPIDKRKNGNWEVGAKKYESDFFVTASGKAKRRKLLQDETEMTTPQCLTRQHLERPCRGGPHKLFIAAGSSGDISLTDDAQLYLQQRAIEWHVASLEKAMKAYNDFPHRKAAMVYLA